jgi:hypothetical protein
MMLLSIGDRVKAGEYRLHSRFTRVVNFRHGPSLAAVVSSSVGPGPVNIEVSGLNLEEIDSLRVGAGDLHLGRWHLRYGRAQVYDSSIARSDAETESIRSGSLLLREAIIAAAPPKSLAFLLDRSRMRFFSPGFERAVALHLGSGVRRLLAGDLAGGVSRLSGCGFGLTPSGDDFICGMLAGFRFMEKTGGRDFRAQVGAIYGAARTGGLLAGSFLSLAVEGRVDRKIRDLLTAVCCADCASIREAAGMLMRAGETSGADLAVGLVTALEGWL